MITIFSNPRPFTGIFKDIQLNAIKSWLALGSEVEIILFEDEEKTTSKIAEELGIMCITDVECNEFGTPLLHSVFKKVKQFSHYDIICQVNADIILNPSFLEGVRTVKNILGEKDFFMSGRRWDFNMHGLIDFSVSQWEEKLMEKVQERATLHGFSGMDYWMFPKKMDFAVPAFVIGRPGMDSWLVYRSLALKIPVIDATDVITIVHQNHPYPKKALDSFAIEKEKNTVLAGGVINAMTLREANFLLKKTGIEKPRFPRILFSTFALFYPWRILLLAKRKLEKSIGRG